MTFVVETALCRFVLKVSNYETTCDRHKNKGGSASADRYPVDRLLFPENADLVKSEFCRLFDIMPEVIWA